MKKTEKVLTYEQAIAAVQTGYGALKSAIAEAWAAAKRDGIKESKVRADLRKAGVNPATVRQTLLRLKKGKKAGNGKWTIEKAVKAFTKHGYEVIKNKDGSYTIRKA